jgi:hypothetical protein
MKWYVFCLPMLLFSSTICADTIGPMQDDPTLADKPPHEVLENDILEMENRFLSSRKSINSARVVFHSRLTKFARDPARENVIRSREVLLDGDKMRYDSLVGEFRRQTIFTKDMAIRNTSPTSHVLVLSPPPTSPRDIPNPLLYGITAWYSESVNQRGYEELFLNPIRDQFSISEGRDDDGMALSKVSFRLRDEVFGEYWLAKNKGGFPVYIEVHTGKGEQHYSRSINVKLKLYEPNVWYPSEVVFRIRMGGQLVTEEVLTVEDAEFEQSVPDSAFTLEGLNLPKGRTVLDGPKVRVWSGERLIDQLEYELNQWRASRTLGLEPTTETEK